MTYEEAIKLSLTVKWKTSTCPSGDACWCRVIEPVEKIEDKDGNEIYIVGAGSILKEYANYIVDLHNNSIDLAPLREFVEKFMLSQKSINDIEEIQ